MRYSSSVCVRSFHPVTIGKVPATADLLAASVWCNGRANGQTTSGRHARAHGGTLHAHARSRGRRTTFRDDPALLAGRGVAVDQGMHEAVGRACGRAHCLGFRV